MTLDTNEKILNLSPTVQRARDTLQSHRTISAVMFADSIVKQHGEYGYEKAGELSLNLDLHDRNRLYSSQEWLEIIRTFFDPSLAPKLHGRLVIIGLSLLDNTLYQQLQQNNFFSELVRELYEPLDAVLTPRGRESYERVVRAELQTSSTSHQTPPLQSQTPIVSTDHPANSEVTGDNTSDKENSQKPSTPSFSPDLDEIVPILPDNPLVYHDADQLGRVAFARFLAARIAAIGEEQRAYSIHLYGPWGSGKSTVLNFLKEALQEPVQSATTPSTAQQPTRPPQWLVVDFNAWQHQHIRPPWWALMDSVFQQTKNHLGWRGRWNEYWWRLTSGRLHYILAAVLLLLLVGFIASWISAQNSPQPIISVTTQTSGSTSAQTSTLASSDSSWLSSTADTVANISTILALLATLWGVARGMGQSLLFGSAGAARTYTELTADPMRNICKRFKTLINQLHPHKVAVFIDDLDRCQSAYVVDLLEGIQTLFRDAPVLFVVAADRHWVNACFEEVYKSMTPWVYAPGKPLGILFLEKAFQFSASVPSIPDTLRQTYWESLIVNKTTQEDLETVRKEAAAEVATAKNESALLHLVDKSQQSNDSFVKQQVLREAAAVSLATPPVEQSIAHTLKPLAPLLEPNPRMMKRLVNAYSVNRATSLLAFINIDHNSHVLALWTILEMRWPKLADYLAQHPQMVNVIGKPLSEAESEQIPQEIQSLFSAEQVYKVVQGDGVVASLHEADVRLCAFFKSMRGIEKGT